jgi:hypothetical protein
MSKPFKKFPKLNSITSLQTYSVPDLSEIFNVGQSTIYRWIKCGLKTIDSHEPYLMFGSDIKAWIKSYKPKPKKPNPRKTYCVKCRDRVEFDFDNAFIKERSDKSKYLQSRCVHCDCLVTKFGQKALETFEEVKKGLTCSSFPPANKQIKKENSHHEIQCKKREGQIPLFGDADLWKNE